MPKPSQSEDTRAYTWLKSYNSAYYSNGTPSHIDQNEVFEELSRGSKTEYPVERRLWATWATVVQPSLEAYNKAAGNAIHWHDVMTDGSTIRRVPRIQRPAMVFALRVLNYAREGHNRHPKEFSGAWEIADLEFLVKDPTTTREVPRFWLGAKFECPMWRSQYMEPPHQDYLPMDPPGYAPVNLDTLYSRKIANTLGPQVVNDNLWGVRLQRLHDELAEEKSRRLSVEKLTTENTCHSKTCYQEKDDLISEMGEMEQHQRWLEKEIIRQTRARKEAEAELLRLRANSNNSGVNTSPVENGYRLLTALAESVPGCLPTILELARVLGRDSLDIVLGLDTDVVVNFWKNEEVRSQILSLATFDPGTLRWFLNADKALIRLLSTSSLEAFSGFIRLAPKQISLERSQAMEEAQKQARSEQREKSEWDSD